MGDEGWTEVRRGKRGRGQDRRSPLDSSSYSEFRGNDSSSAQGSGGSSSREMFSGNPGRREDRGSRGHGNGGRRGGRVDQYAAVARAPSHLGPSRNGILYERSSLIILFMHVNTMLECFVLINLS